MFSKEFWSIDTLPLISMLSTWKDPFGIESENLEFHYKSEKLL